MDYISLEIEAGAGVESEPGKKDKRLMAEFIQRAKAVRI